MQQRKRLKLVLLINRAHVIARGTGEDLFGNKVSDDERKEAENYLQQNVKRK